MLKRTAGSLALAIIGAAVVAERSPARAAELGEGGHYRVFVADHAKPVVTAFELEKPETRWSFAIQGQAKLYAIANGAAVAAVQSDDDTVQFIRSGVSLHDHGDHKDLEIEDPAAIVTVLKGRRPFHLVSHGGKAVINYDLGGYAEILDEHEVAEGKVAVTRFPQLPAHHGFVTSIGDTWFSTVASDAPVKDGAAPPRLGLRAFKLDGTPLSDLQTCTAVHGEAFSGDFLAAGCREGVLTVTMGASGPNYRMLGYPDDLPKGVTTGTLLGDTGIQMFLGNHGADGLVVIDPAEAPHFERIGLSFRRIDFALDPVNPGTGFVLTEDGSLHRIDLLKAQLTASAKVTQAYSMDGHWNEPRPRLAMAGDEILLTDPRAALVRRIDTKTLKETGTIAVPGLPYNLIVVGGSGISH